MFNGIVEEVGSIAAIVHQRNLTVLKVRARKIVPGTKNGDSIAIDGVCLTVTGKNKNILAFDLMRETIETTTLKDLQRGHKINLERALLVGGRISGHFVTGHIDCVGCIENKKEEPNYTELFISLPNELSKYIVPKGSVCLDGVSLTVGKVKKGLFSVYLIPFTRRITTLGTKKKGDAINIEVDILAKYILNTKRKNV